MCSSDLEESQVDKRGLSLDLQYVFGLPYDDEDTANQLLDDIQNAMNQMLFEACSAALDEWGGDRSTITHVLFGTNSGCQAPSHDVALVDKLNLPLTVERVSVDHMGVAGGPRMLALASELACSSPKHRVLLMYCDMGVGLSATMSGHLTRQDIMSATLFADGAGACVLGSAATGREKALYEVHSWKSHMLSQVRHEMAPDASISKEIGRASCRERV